MEFKFTKVDPDESDETRKLYKYYSSDLRLGYTRVQVGDVEYCMPSKYQMIAESISNFEVYDDDIWVITFPKSGTTWSQEMVWLIGNDLDFEKAKNTVLVERFPFIDFSLIFDIHHLEEDLFSKFPEILMDSVGFTAKLTSPRFIKCHLPWELLPNQIKNGTTKAKIIYVARNPKDVCISYFHHCCLLEKYTGSISDYCDMFLADLGCYVPFWNHIVAFWERRHQSNLLYITYEDMKKDVESVIRKTADFLGKTLTDDGIDALKKHISFESMKKNPAVNMENVGLFWDHLGNRLEKGNFIRRGAVGSYKDEMPPEYVKKFDEWIEENLKKFNLSLESV